ncbi:MAG: N-formylglutamate deformylase [Sediminimonas qiaohouensis]|uniref:N-formylglutamate deformylase n=1 Tax=Sediminimonas qiaohouensis TaxID=552061 RepID=A0A7C9L6F8_9RHOB|nr:N-formylglutamate deformylase [Sediminimonas qiaohouensis]
MSVIEVTRGEGPIVLGLPHTGTEVPPQIWAGLNEVGRALADTDWHVERLYAGLRDDVSTVRTRVHRYVIDVNRPPDGASLYPGQATTGLCPLTDFDGRPIYREGQAPDEAQVARRRAAYHAPYHAALAAELERVKARHGVAILYDCHSIRSEIPHLFDGILPIFNIGTNLSTSCAALVEEVAVARASQAEGFTHVVNGRFRGGWTTRAYCRPDEGVHAIQMELAQASYMQEAPPWRYLEAKAEVLRPHLMHILNGLADVVEAGELR